MSASNQLAAFNYAVQPLGNLQIKNITAAYTVSPSDNNFIINCNSSPFTVSLTAAATLASGFNCWVWHNGTGNSAITIDPSGAETIDGVATIILNRGEGTQIVCDGTNWQTGGKKTMRMYAENAGNSQVRPIASGNLSMALGGLTTGSSATGTGSLAIYGNSSVNRGVAIGVNSNGQFATVATGDAAMALGGSYASGTDSFAAAIANNSGTYGATSANCIAMGYRALANNSRDFAVGNTSTASGGDSVALGSTNTASGLGAVAIGYNVQATGAASVAIGSYSKAIQIGKFAFSSAYSGAWNYGEQQYGILSLIKQTADATPTVLTSNTGAASTTNQVILPNNSAFSFSGTIIARQQAAGGNDYAAWEVKGAILRAANAASTVLGSYNINVLSKTAGASAWDLTLSADTTNGGLAVTATGAASVNIRWVATIQTSECTYA